MTKSIKRPKLAVMGAGLVATGMFNQGIPSFVALLNHLSKQYDITFYNFIPVSSALRNVEQYKFKLVSVPMGKTPVRIKYLILIVQLLLHHLKQPYKIFYAMAAVPAGRVAIILGKLLSIPVVVNYYFGELAKLPDIQFGDLLHKKRYRITRWVSKHADALVVLSHFQRKKIKDELRLGRKVDVIYSGIEINLDSRIYKKISFPVKFIHVAHLMPVKDQETLLKAFALIATRIDCQLKIFGIDAMEGAVQKWIDDLGLNASVIVSAPIPHAQLFEHYYDFHIMLHTSKYENQPQAVMEAMACGTVVCGTNVGFLEDLAEKCVMTVGVGEYKLLAEKVIELISDEKRYAELQTNSYEWVKEHSVEWTAEQFTQLFARVSDKRI